MQVILKDFDRIYGALYDMLNMNYRERRVQTTEGDEAECVMGGRQQGLIEKYKARRDVRYTTYDLI